MDTRKLLSGFKLNSSSLKWIDELERRETWEEACDRVFDMHNVLFSKQRKENPKFNEYFEYALDSYKKQSILASMRSLQFGGDGILKHNGRMFNCLSGYCDRPIFFQECMYWLLCGSGVGFSVQHKHINRLPKIQKRSKHTKTFVIPDNIEGWSDAIGILMSTYFVGEVPFPEYQGRTVHFDFSLIRPSGSFISGGFKSAGSDGLRKALIKIENLLESELKNESIVKMRSIVAYDVVMYLSDAVLSGGVRRSATICLFSPDDNEMLKAKTGDWYTTNPQRARSNNSVVLLRDKTTREDFYEIMKSVKEWGEPGFVWSDSEDIIYNPCVEIGMFPQTVEGKSGWQGCVSHDTPMITKEGLTTIGEAVDNSKEISIWNGKSWKYVKPFQTGENRDLYRVSFSDGSYLDCTDNHKFMAKDRFTKDFDTFTTSELAEKIESSKYYLYTPNTNVLYNDGTYVINAYDYGVILGGGIAKKIKKPLSITLEDVFTWDRKSILAFIAGWADAGKVNTRNGIRLYGNEENIRLIQLLLTKVGVKSNVNTIIDVIGTISELVEISLDDIWCVHITNTSDIPCQVLNCNSIGVDIDQNNHQNIISIIKLEGLHNSYCLEEIETHNCLFGNILTKQCNLVEINGAICETEEDFYSACKAAAIAGTLQAAYTDFKYVESTSKEIFDREALLGCSITGMMNQPNICFNERIQRKGAEIIREINKEVAAMIGINQAARTTCVKPSGNASVTLGCASGIHGEHSEMYFRNVQMNKEDDVARYFVKNNPNAVEDSVWSTNNTDWVISFPVVSQKGSIFKSALEGVKQLEYVKLTQQNWVEYGTNVELCIHPKTRHNVSNTISVDDWDAVGEYIYENRYWLAGVSLLSTSGDRDYAQAPFTAVYTPEQILEKYGDGQMLASGLIVDGLQSFHNNLWEACSQLTDPSPKYNLTQKTAYNALMRDWVRRAEQFAERYFNGDITQMTYCLKDVYNYHRWLEITREMKEVDWTELNIKPDYVKVDSISAMSCNGGACEVIF